MGIREIILRDLFWKLQNKKQKNRKNGNQTETKHKTYRKNENLFQKLISYQTIGARIKTFDFSSSPCSNKCMRFMTLHALYIHSYDYLSKVDLELNAGVKGFYCKSS